MWNTLYRDIMVSYIDVLSDTSRDLYVEHFYIEILWCHT